MTRWQERDIETREREAAFERAARKSARSVAPRPPRWRRLAQSVLEESYALRTIQTRRGRHVDQP